VARNLIKACLTLLAGDYAPYRIYTVDLVPAPPTIPSEPGIEMRTIEEGPDTLGFAAFVDSARACACWIWYGERYRRERNFWPLGAKEAKLVQIETDPEFRGRGLAVKLLHHAGAEMRRRGFERMYARIWHSNVPSMRAFEKAGWTYEKFVLEVDPLRIGHRLRMTFKGRR
jgi:GNAT superfamily N-acetyltransferase